MGAGCTKQPVLTSPTKGLSYGVIEAGGHSPGRVSGVTPQGLSVGCMLTWVWLRYKDPVVQLICTTVTLYLSCTGWVCSLKDTVRSAIRHNLSGIPRGLPTWTVFMGG